MSRRLRGGLCSAEEETTDDEATTGGEMTDDEVVGAGGDESDDVKLFDGFLIGSIKSLGGIGVSLLVKPGRRIGAAGAGAR